MHLSDSHTKAHHNARFDGTSEALTEMSSLGRGLRTKDGTA